MAMTNTKSPKGTSAPIGVGLQLGRKADGKIRILRVAEGSPADECGKIFADDIIISIDSEPVAESIQEVSEQLQGQHGSFVTVRVKRDAMLHHEYVNVTLQRTAILSNPPALDMINKVNGRSADPVAEADMIPSSPQAPLSQEGLVNILTSNPFKGNPFTNLNNTLGTVFGSAQSIMSPTSSSTTPRPLPQSPTSAGIGVILTTSEGGMFISKIAPGSPADLGRKACVGDLILFVDGQVASYTLEGLTAQLQGPPGSTVTIDASRHLPDGREDYVRYSVVRQGVPNVPFTQDNIDSLLKASYQEPSTTSRLASAESTPPPPPAPAYVAAGHSIIQMPSVEEITNNLSWNSIVSSAQGMGEAIFHAPEKIVNSINDAAHSAHLPAPSDVGSNVLRTGEELMQTTREVVERARIDPRVERISQIPSNIQHSVEGFQHTVEDIVHAADDAAHKVHLGSEDFAEGVGGVGRTVGAGVGGVAHTVVEAVHGLDSAAHKVHLGTEDFAGLIKEVDERAHRAHVGSEDIAHAVREAVHSADEVAHKAHLPGPSDAVHTVEELIHGRGYASDASPDASNLPTDVKKRSHTAEEMAASYQTYLQKLRENASPLGEPAGSQTNNMQQGELVGVGQDKRSHVRNPVPDKPIDTPASAAVSPPSQAPHTPRSSQSTPRSTCRNATSVGMSSHTLFMAPLMVHDGIIIPAVQLIGNYGPSASYAPSVQGSSQTRKPSVAPVPPLLPDPRMSPPPFGVHPHPFGVHPKVDTSSASQRRRSPSPSTRPPPGARGRSPTARPVGALPIAHPSLRQQNTPRALLPSPPRSLSPVAFGVPMHHVYPQGAYSQPGVVPRHARPHASQSPQASPRGMPGMMMMMSAPGQPVAGSYGGGAMPMVYGNFVPLHGNYSSAFGGMPHMMAPSSSYMMRPY